MENRIVKQCFNCKAETFQWISQLNGNVACVNCYQFYAPRTDRDKSNRSNVKGSDRVCVRCRTTATRSWRTHVNGSYLCDACGKYFTRNNKHRPDHLVQRKTRESCINKEAVSDYHEGESFNEKKESDNVRMCARCRSTSTCAWRRDENGSYLCNTCGTYFMRNKKHRPDYLIERQLRESCGINKRVNDNEEGEILNLCVRDQ